ncbi:EAL domain-containing protein [Rhodoblastus acidophilus]|uniref:EAL domain-containing protein n=1 Tax=Candidatus Rhodoblastus alkanivorans TaxID=2954117 RepID=A0ABS9Z989_9HYPH|nr:EAL domain-containing protein [Candidatus Rhodoblastus alkanivorans]MCI4680341.1 EAL domain-containing protein [Candidatus Rhodoblastus alkanivorans]MCI4684006.1 EAL domain-containing protein [Candidatus Rhodoblastus alkanivorans]MDI4641325.1 EAL domain-containing protein [Rhodoblastus acidophilus]
MDAKLVESQHQELAALALGTIVAPIFLLYISHHEKQNALVIIASLLLVAGLIRIGATLLYRKYHGTHALHATRAWKAFTVATVLLFSTTLGVFAYVAIAYTDDTRLHLASLAIVSAYAAGTVGRNAALQAGITGQLATTVLLVAIALMQKHDYIYQLLAVLVFLYLISLRNISKSVYDLLVSVFKSNEEKQVLIEAITEKSERFDAALSNMPHGLAMFDDSCQVVVVNRKFGELLHIAKLDAPLPTIDKLFDLSVPALFLGRNERAILAARMRAIIANQRQQEIEIETNDGHTLEMAFQPKSRGGSVVIVTDVTEKKAAERRITHLAHHDKLTELPNRGYFEEKFKETLEACLGADTGLAVMALDLDQFKAVNDTLGHLVGDELLIAVSKRIRKIIGDDDFVARFGGDEFMLTHRTAKDGDDGLDLAARLIEGISAPYRLGAHDIKIGVTVGVAHFPADGADPSNLLRNADLALYRAKHDRRGTFRLFEPEMDREACERWQFESDLSVALELGQLHVFYQPIIDIDSQTIIGCESLLRWHHPKNGWISPDRFIQIAEETGMIVEIGRWALEKACRDAVSWPKDASVSVNLSAIQFRHQDIVATVRDALAASGLPPQRLDLEITESILLEDREAVRRSFTELRSLGISISLDDFGTGYSSLSYLVDYPIDKVKLDRSFITAITTSREKLAIVRTVAMLAQELGLILIAEGVETIDELRAIEMQRISRVQGFFFSKPVPVDQIPWPGALNAFEKRLREIAQRSA